MNILLICLVALYIWVVFSLFFPVIVLGMLVALMAWAVFRPKPKKLNHS